MTRRLTWLSLLLLLLLSGCSGMRLVESRVTAVATQVAGQTIPADARYRFERLPSQVNDPHTEQVEALAEAELAEFGLVRDDAAARYSVQINTRMQPFLADAWGRPLGANPVRGQIMIGTGGFGGGFGLGIGMGMGMGMPPPTQYRHEAGLLLRELASGQVVYETSAIHDGPWNDSDNILRALLAAALKDFPNPPAGTRQVKVEIPR